MSSRRARLGRDVFHHLRLLGQQAAHLVEDTHPGDRGVHGERSHGPREQGHDPCGAEAEQK
jgi:hypothetical protein